MLCHLLCLLSICPYSPIIHFHHVIYLQATSVCLRAPVSESLSRLHRDQLQKFAQYLISELPQQVSISFKPIHSPPTACIISSWKWVLIQPAVAASPGLSELNSHWVRGNLSLCVETSPIVAKVGLGLSMGTWWLTIYYSGRPPKTIGDHGQKKNVAVRLIVVGD